MASLSLRPCLRSLFRNRYGAPLALVAAMSAVSLCGLPAAGQMAAAAPAASPFSGLRWRLIGPFRGGRVLAVSGIAGNAEEFYFGAVSGADSHRVYALIENQKGGLYVSDDAGASRDVEALNTLMRKDGVEAISVPPLHASSAGGNRAGDPGR